MTGPEACSTEKKWIIGELALMETNVARPLLPRTYIERLHLRRPDSCFEAYLCISGHSFAVSRARRTDFLHSRELFYYDSLSFERRQKSFLLGRYCAKQAISAFLPEPDMRRFSIHHGVLSQPIVRHSASSNVQIGISHCDDCGGAIAYPEELPMAIDLERIDDDRMHVIQSQCTPEELALSLSLPVPAATGLTLLWTAKESLSKELRCGLMSPFQIFEVKDVEPQPDSFIWTFRRFAQYQATSFLIGNTACSIITPRKTEMTLDTGEINKVVCDPYPD